MTPESGLRSQQGRLMRAIMALSCAAILGCQSNMPWLHHPLGNNNPDKSLGVVIIERFTCRDEIVSESVQNVFLSEFADISEEVRRSGTGDIVIEGAITMSDDASSQSSGAAWNGAAGVASRSQAGRYVTGISAILKKGDRIIAGANHSQSRGQHTDVVAPEALASRTVEILKDELRRKKLLPW